MNNEFNNIINIKSIEIGLMFKTQHDVTYA